MSANSRLTCGVLSVTEANDVNNLAVRSEKLTSPAAFQLKPAKKTRNRIPPAQRLRVMEKYALGQNQTAIARDEKINQETVARIVKSAEMESYIEHVRERWRGLCDSAIEVVRQKLKEGDKEVYNRP
jgi:hypothetical protein